MAMRWSKVFTLVLCIIMSTSIALPASKGKGNGKGKGQTQQPAEETKGKGAKAGISVFAEKDRETIRKHYHSDQGNLPPGLAKREGDLPSGLMKQLKRNGHLPPGLEKKWNPFPVELERKLPPLREGLQRAIIGGNAIILDGKTKVILDIFKIL
jgi:hypothetical protein